jgi:hypothetical protein
MKLPNGERADLGSKLEEYVLNPRPRDGRHKARMFESLLGITLANCEVLRETILRAVAAVNAESRGENGTGWARCCGFRSGHDEAKPRH